MRKPIKYTDEPIKARIIKDFLPPPEQLRFRHPAVRVNYDTRTDTLTITFRQGAVASTEELAPGILVDLDARGNIVSMEMLDASKRAENPKAMEFAVS